MRTVKLEKNDDTVLDPADPGLVTRGSLFIDGQQQGAWEHRRDGSWVALMNGARERIIEASEGELIARLAAMA